MVQLLSGGWRSDLAALASTASRSVLVVAPFIKEDEAAWFCGQLGAGVEVTPLANVDAEAISTAALDLGALRRLAEASPSARVIALSNLHAKVFVADEAATIITSGNLTRSGLDRNLEYGVLLQEPDTVRTVRGDMLAFARLGSEVDAATIAELAPLEEELRQARAGITRDAPRATKRQFNEVAPGPPRTGIHAGGRTQRALRLRRRDSVRTGTRAAIHQGYRTGGEPASARPVRRQRLLLHRRSTLRKDLEASLAPCPAASEAQGRRHV